MLQRAVLDTNILVAAFSSRRGASFALLDAAINGWFQWLASPALWLEYEAVLKRAEIRKLHGLSAKDIDEALDALAANIIPVASHYLWRPQLRDPQDELVLEAAVNGSANALVTLNARDFTPAASQFGISILPPKSFLALVFKGKSP